MKHSYGLWIFKRKGNGNPGKGIQLAFNGKAVGVAINQLKPSVYIGKPNAAHGTFGYAGCVGKDFSAPVSYTHLS